MVDSAAFRCQAVLAALRLVPEDVWQLRAPVDELVLVGQRGSEGNKLNLVSAETLRLRGHVVQLEEEDKDVV